VRPQSQYAGRGYQVPGARWQMAGGFGGKRSGRTRFRVGWVGTGHWALGSPVRAGRSILLSLVTGESVLRTRSLLELMAALGTPIVCPFPPSSVSLKSWA
jgi:hypothetical protein